MTRGGKTMAQKPAAAENAQRGPKPAAAPVPAPGETLFETRPGRPHPLGATPDADGTNFAIFSQHATTVELLLFDAHDARQPVKTIDLDPDRNRTFYFWHVYVRA